MKAESIPPALRNLLTKLEYISMIERGQKPCFSDMTFVQSNSWFGAWKRLFSGENRKNLLFEIEQIIDRTILAVEEYSNKEYVKLLLENLAKAKTGIENLILTYTEHPDTVSNLRVHIINIDLTLKKFGYKPSKIEDCQYGSTLDLQKMIDNMDKKRTSPLPIAPTIEPKFKLKTDSFKRFTPKDYIEKHASNLLSSSASSPEQPVGSQGITNEVNTSETQ